MNAAKIPAKCGPDTRPARILRLLAASPDGLSTAQIVDELGDETAHARQRLLCKFMGDLRRHEGRGFVKETGRTSGGRRQGPSVTWVITEAGRDRLAWLDSVPSLRADAEQAARQRLERQAAKESTLADAGRLYDQATPLTTRVTVARDLRDLGCTLHEIGQAFGVTRETIRLNLNGKTTGVQRRQS